MYKHKNIKQSNNKKLLLILLAVALVALAGGGYFAYAKSKNKSNEVVNTGPTPEQIKQEADVNDQNKKAFIENEQATKPGDPSSPGTTPAPPTSDSTVEARQESNGSVTVLSKLYGISSGTCSLSATNAGKSITKTADVIYQPEFSTCTGFSIPSSELGAGTWNITIAVTGGNKDAKVSTTVEVR